MEEKYQKAIASLAVRISELEEELKSEQRLAGLYKVWWEQSKAVQADCEPKPSDGVVNV